MNRKIVPRKLNNTIAVIVDGKDEKWYIEVMKEHYPCNSIKSIRIDPALPQKKKIQELFDLAESKCNEGFVHVFLMVDMDVPNCDSGEFQKFKNIYEKYVGVKSNELQGRQLSKYKWMHNLTIIINNPCLEYWHLIHFKTTNKYYRSYNEMKNDLLKYLPGYEKSERYYKESPDIFMRLGELQGLSVARGNAQKICPFDIRLCKEAGSSEMDKLFDFFDTL